MVSTITCNKPSAYALSRCSAWTRFSSERRGRFARKRTQQTQTLSALHLMFVPHVPSTATGVGTDGLKPPPPTDAHPPHLRLQNTAHGHQPHPHPPPPPLPHPLTPHLPTAPHTHTHMVGRQLGHFGHGQGSSLPHDFLYCHTTHFHTYTRYHTGYALQNTFAPRA